MALGGVVQVACVAGVERGGKRGEIIRERGGSGRKGEKGSHAGLPTPYYNYVECKLRNTNFEYLRWPNTVFLYLYVIRRYFQATGKWEAKIGNMQNQLKKIIF